MTDTDKTREKLLSSIRKTKAAADKEAAATPETPAPPIPSAPAASAPASRASAASAAKTKRPAMPATDPYRSGRRVWPD